MTELAPDKLVTPEIRAALVAARACAPITRKGGVGKTYSAAQLMGMAARAGMKVLGVELDSQDTLGLSLGLRDKNRTRNEGDDGASLRTALITGTQPLVLRGVREYENGGRLDIIPSGESIDAALTALSVLGYAERTPYQARLAEIIAPLAGEYNYDLIVFDCDPKQKVARELVYVAARYAWAPVDVDPSSYIDGVRAVGRELKSLRALNPTLRFLGVLPFAVPFASIRADLKARERAQNGEELPVTNHLAKMRTEVNDILRTERVDPTAPDSELLFAEDHAYGLPVVFQSAIREGSIAASRAREAGKLLFEVVAERQQLAAEREAGPSVQELLLRQAAGEDVSAELEAMRARADALRALPGSAENMFLDYQPWFSEMLRLMLEVERAEQAGGSA
ncbi:hypothetical protein TH66_00175 [Carbonactinospora thermoautotrophica]|uniref:AAA domain-containing protein n=1 Tax=Carbonactinospora thermoautotrophica TaxID=1469144 RepID=A0A132N754_9ACTN|nr:AAA family ATPase [Carbonactinospora thermoautotrophica]KWX04631.1 hypothetical protein TR74_24220 [Carbonactinospora thermoautotrophica]KWX05969.1 hypothetical protein TH66_00175 [Carbonactinospora thermoautotrophica]